MVELMAKTRVIQASSKTGDWVIQGQLLLLTFQSFNQCHLPWRRMLSNGRNVHGRQCQGYEEKCSVTNKTGSLMVAILENKFTLIILLLCNGHHKEMPFSVLARLHEVHNLPISDCKGLVVKNCCLVPMSCALSVALHPRSFRPKHWEPTVKRLH